MMTHTKASVAEPKGNTPVFRLQSVQQRLNSASGVEHHKQLLHSLLTS